ncbi:MAG: helix-turn-helix domain-containing protein [Deltaproteobacteria bacterium]
MTASKKGLRLCVPKTVVSGSSTKKIGTNRFWPLSGLVAEALSHSPLRFNALQRNIHGISRRTLTLTLTLRGVERDGLVNRTMFPTIPPWVDYALTEVGYSLKGPLQSLVEWARARQDEIVAAQVIFDQR